MQRIALLSAALLLTACQPGPPDNGGGGGGASTPEQAIAQVMVGLCGGYARCLNETANGAVLREVFLQFNEAGLHALLDQTACAANIGNDSGLGAMAAAGRIKINMEKTQSCITQMNTSCRWLGEGPGDCGGFFEPMVELGGVCADDEECIGDNSCTAGPGQCGECVAAIALGDPCTFGGIACASGSTCDGMSSLCVEAAAPGGTGAACTSDDSFFSACTSSNDLCIDGICTTFTVSTSEGADCSDEQNTVCGAGMFCFGGTCSSAVAAEGESCMDGQNRSAQCSASSYCRYDRGVGTCEPYLQIGETCEGTLRCAADLSCDMAESVCTAKAAIGEDCLGGSECTSGACQEHLCVPRYPELCE
jgi:hypothetical protein